MVRTGVSSIPASPWAAPAHGRDILVDVNWPMLLLALACLLPVGAGVAILLAGDGGAPLAWGLIGFFGAGVVVLGRKALGRD